MDNLAHSLVGLAAAKAGLEKLSPAATTVCILAANAPDIDFLAAFSGDRWTVLHYHRGVTHSIVGTISLAFIVPILFWLVEFAICKFRRTSRRLRLRGLLIASVITAATHPLLDWTNSYGVRPFLPWSGRWLYGDLVFVVDPILWVILGGATFLLTANNRFRLAMWSFLGSLLTALVVYVTVSRRAVEHGGVILVLWLACLAVIGLGHKLDFGKRFGRDLAVVSLILIVGYWCSMAFLHARAMISANDEVSRIIAGKSENLVRLAATPSVVNPMRWRCVAETSNAAYRFDIYLGQNGARNLVHYEKLNEVDAAIAASVKTDRRARYFLEFARFPVERVAGADCTTQTLVQFADLRYTEPGQARGSFALDLPIECPATAR